MTLAQTRNFVLTRLSLQSLKRYRRTLRQDGSWRCGIFDPDYLARGTIVEPVPTPLTYYGVKGNLQVLS